MKNGAFSIILIILISSLCNSQTLRRPAATNYIGLGAYSIHHADIFSFTLNPSSLAQLKNPSAGVYAERRFMISELNNYIAAFALPTKSGNFGMKTYYFGFNEYNETLLGLVYSRSLGNKLDIGASFNYHLIRIAGYGSSAAINFELGTVLHLTENLHAGLVIENPAGGKFGLEQKEKLPLLYTIGIGYDASPKFLLTTTIEKEEDRTVNVNAGFQYKFIPQLLARAGISTATSSVWMGLGLSMRALRVDITIHYHPRLGLTPGLSLLISRSQRKD